LIPRCLTLAVNVSDETGLTGVEFCQLASMETRSLYALGRGGININMVLIFLGRRDLNKSTFGVPGRCPARCPADFPKVPGRSPPQVPLFLGVTCGEKGWGARQVPGKVPGRCPARRTSISKELRIKNKKGRNTFPGAGPDRGTM
jgi:hypothetical protein